MSLGDVELAEVLEPEVSDLAVVRQYSIARQVRDLSSDTGRASEITEYSCTFQLQACITTPLTLCLTYDYVDISEEVGCAFSNGDIYAVLKDGTMITASQDRGNSVRTRMVPGMKPGADFGRSR